MSAGGKGSTPRPLSVSHTQFDANWDAIFGKKDTVMQNSKPECHCYKCNEKYIEPGTGFSYVLTHMIVCPQCGNKRCPHATNHTLGCTNSNEPGQSGSIYE